MRQFDTNHISRNLRAVVNDVEDILHAMSDATSDRADDLRSLAGRKLHDARDRLGAIEAQGSRQLRRAGRQTQDYVSEHPWKTLGSLAALGVALVMLTRRRH